MTHSIGLVLALAGRADSTPASLKAAEAALATASAERGVAAALGPRLSADVVIVYPGAQVVSGRAKVAALLAAQARLDSVGVTLSDRQVWLSKDQRWAAAIGETVVKSRSGSATNPGTYVLVWTLVGGDWQIAALLLTGLARPGSTVVPPGSGPVEWPALAAAGPAKAFIQADADFAKLAGTRGAPEAFRAFAAPNAVVQGAALRKGPAEIAAGIAAGDPANWEWQPVAAGGSAGGDLGFTVGQSKITPKAGGETSFGKYLTVWTRLPNGDVRFLTDGGNARPKP